jgi:hypothetical protein
VWAYHEVVFGSVDVGCAPERTVTIRNVGDEHLALTGFAVPAGPFVLRRVAPR